MLVVGYLGIETKVIDIGTSIIFRFILCMAFYIIYSAMSSISKTYFNFLFGVWSLYGVAAV
jgi:hypothetical protein